MRKICWKFHSKIFIQIKVQNQYFFKNGPKNLTKVENFNFLPICWSLFYRAFQWYIACFITLHVSWEIKGTAVLNTFQAPLYDHVSIKTRYRWCNLFVRKSVKKIGSHAIKYHRDIAAAPSTIESLSTCNWLGEGINQNSEATHELLSAKC